MIHILSLSNSHNKVASLQKNRGNKSHRVIVALDHCKPIARKKPGIIILHVGTNDLKSNEESSIVKNIVEIKEAIKRISPLTKTMISLIISRYNSELLNDKAIIVNERLKADFLSSQKPLAAS